MGYVFSDASLDELDGVHPDLVWVAKRAIELTTQDFAVHDGIRTLEEQRGLVDAGASHTLNSLHLRQDDGYGHAVDLVPYLNGRLRWEWGPIYRIAQAVRRAASERRLWLRWGAVWDRPLGELGDDLEAAVEAYAARRRALGRRVFLDGPHYEIWT